MTGSLLLKSSEKDIAFAHPTSGALALPLSGLFPTKPSPAVKTADALGLPLLTIGTAGVREKDGAFKGGVGG